MKFSGRILEVNCLFLLVLVLLMGFQLFLQHAEYQERLREREVSPLQDTTDAPPHPPGLADPPAASGAEGQGGTLGEDGHVAAAPIVPNIRKSFTKRKAPYVRKAKKNKKKNKNRKNKHQRGDVAAPKHTGGRSKRGHRADKPQQVAH